MTDFTPEIYAISKININPKISKNFSDETMYIYMHDNEIDAKPDENCEIVTHSDLTDDIEETAFNRKFNNKSDGNEQIKRIEQRIPSARKQTCNILT